MKSGISRITLSTILFLLFQNFFKNLASKLGFVQVDVENENVKKTHTTPIIVRGHNENYKFPWDIIEGEIPSGEEQHKNPRNRKHLEFTLKDGFTSVISEYSLLQNIKPSQLCQCLIVGVRLLKQCHRIKSGQTLH